MFRLNEFSTWPHFGLYPERSRMKIRKKSALDVLEFLQIKNSLTF
jgi:hypothetical protein